MSDTYSILWREIKRYQKSKKGLAIILIQPLIWLVVIGSTFSKTDSVIESIGLGETSSYIEFLTPGVIILTAILTSMNGGSNVLWDRKNGFMNKALVSPISRHSIVFGYVGAISIIAVVQSGIIVGLAFFIGVHFENLSMIIPIMFTVFLFSVGFSGISVIFAFVMKSQESFWAVINFLSVLLFMFSPALFPQELLPNWMENVVQFNPVTYEISVIREMMNGMTDIFSVWVSLGIVTVFAICAVVLARQIFHSEFHKPL